MAGKSKPDLMGQRIKRLRDARGLTQQELAKAAGITQAMLSQIENGQRQGRQLRLDAVMRMAFALQVGIGELTGTWVDYQEQGEESEQLAVAVA